MRIKKIELHGFKSFVDKVTVDLPYGVTGVVGPNGCGKSNIVDAIRWVLGEQSSRNLRGKSMEDVIFNGSENRAPTGLAEVNITFDNSEGRIGGPYSSYSEISIGRRLFRSGESEYLINKTGARLRDIQDIFMDTGVGSRAHYSIIEQGKIGLVLSAKPEDRRTLIEEAAGISKYRARKEAAARRIDATQQNLLRINDVIAEVKRQMDYTKRQAQKAKKHVALKEEYLALEAKLWRVDYREEKLKLNDSEARQQEQSQKEEQLKFVVNELENELEQKRFNLLEKEKEIQTIQEEVFKKQSEISLLEKDMEHFDQVVKNLEERTEKNQGLLERAREELAVATGQMQDAKSRFEDAITSDQSITEQFETQEEQLKEKEEELLEKEKEIETCRDQINQLVTKIANGGTTLDNLDRRRIELSGRLAKSRVEEEELQKRLSSLKQVLQKNEQKLEGVQQLQLELKSKTEEGHETLSTLSQEREEAENAVSSHREHLTQLKSRLHVLEELQKNYEGLQTGVRSIMQHKNTAEGTHLGIVGLVAELVSLPKEYERAAEAVLGERLQFVVVKSQQEGLSAVDYLNSHSAGRSSFIPVQLRAETTSTQHLPSGEGVIGPMLNFVESDHEYQQVIEYLFGDVVLVESLQAALSIWSRNGIRKTLVTLDGEVVDAYGVISGGKSRFAEDEEEVEQTADAANLLSRKRNIEELKDNVSKITGDLHASEARVQELTKRFNARKVELEGLKRDSHQEELRMVQQQKELQQIREDCKRCEENLGKVSHRRSDEEAQLAEIQKEEDETTEGMKVAKENKTTSSDQLESARNQAQDLKTLIESFKDRATQTQVRLAEIREQKSHCERDLKRFEKDEKDRHEQINRYEEEIQEAGQEQKDLEHKKEDAKTESLELIKKVQTVQKELNQKRDHYNEVSGALAEKDKTLRSHRKELDQISHALSEVNVQVREAQMRLESLEEKAQEAQKAGQPISLSALIEQAMNPPSHEEMAQEDVFHPDDVEAIAQAREQIKELEQNLSSIGEVNVAAIKELEELSERGIFLNRQKEDLDQSIEALQKTIHKVNRTSRERFRETFEAVNLKFQEVFPRLFGGGKASLLLTDPQNLLETGVDILCQPPGKKIQNVTLLSGGEKALASICLILAIFLIKPSPFCLLDEVDAPLDDANISRFNDLLHEIAKESQLILITHNRHTMDIVDHLYGITMEEPGVSKLVSVNLN